MADAESTSDTTGVEGPTGDGGSRSVRRASLVAGIGLLLVAVLAGWANFAVLEELVTQGDAPRTATAIANAEGTFRLGIASLLLVALLDVVVAWGLYTVFAPVDDGLSRLAAWLRVVYAGVFTVAISHLLGVLHLLSSQATLGAYSTEQRHALVLREIQTYTDIWNAGLVLFGVHLLLLGYLAYRAEYVPTLLGGLLAVAGLGYAHDSLAPLLIVGYSVEVATVTFVGEVVLIAWLLVWGRRLTVSGTEAKMAD